MDEAALDHLRGLIDQGVHDPDVLYRRQVAWHLDRTKQWKGGYQDRVSDPFRAIVGAHYDQIEAQDRPRFTAIDRWTTRNPTSPWGGFDKFQHFVVGDNLAGSWGYWAGAAAGIGAEVSDAVRKRVKSYAYQLGWGDPPRPHHKVGFDPADARITVRGARWSDALSVLSLESEEGFLRALVDGNHQLSRLVEPRSKTEDFSEDFWDLLEESVDPRRAPWFEQLPPELRKFIETHPEEVRRRQLDSALQSIGGERRAAPSVVHPVPDVETLPADATWRFLFSTLGRGDPSTPMGSWTEGMFDEHIARAAELQTALPPMRTYRELYEEQVGRIRDQHALIDGLGALMLTIDPGNKDIGRLVQGARLVEQVRTITTAANLGQMGAMAAMGGYAAVLAGAMSLFSSGEEPNARIAEMLGVVLKQIQALFVELRTVRKEMHQRFDALSRQVEALSHQVRLLRAQVEANDARMERTLDLVRRQLSESLPALIEGQQQILRSMYEIEHRNVLLEAEGFLRVRVVHKGAVVFEDYLREAPVALVAWLDRHGPTASKALQSNLTGSRLDLARLAATTAVGRRLVFKDGGPLNPRLLRYVEADGDSVVPRFVAVEIWARTVGAYLDLVTAFPDLHLGWLPSQGTAQHKVNTAADVAALRDVGRPLARFSEDILAARIEDGALAFDEDFIVALYELLRRRVNDLRTAVWKAQVALVDTNVSETRGVDPFFLGAATDLQNPGTDWLDRHALDHPVHDDAPLRIYGQQAPLDTLRELLISLEPRTPEWRVERRRQVAAAIAPPPEDADFRDRRKNARLPEALLVRMQQLADTLRAAPTRKVPEGSRSLKFDVPSLWLERMPAHLAAAVVSGEAKVRVRYDPRSLKVRHKVYPKPVGPYGPGKNPIPK